MQGELFSNGKDLKEQGIRRVTDNTPEWWIAAWDAEVERLWENCDHPWSSDDVKRGVGDPPHHLNAIGARMSAFRRRHPEAKAIDRIHSGYSAGHAREIPRYLNPKYQISATV